MPGYRMHLVGGAVACVPVIYLLRSYATPLGALAWLAFALAGALFPDIDTASKGQKWFYSLVLPVLAILLILKRISAFILLSFMSFLPLVVSHRGLFHRLWFVMLPPFGIAGLIAWSYPSWKSDAFFAAVFFALGTVSHLVLDMGFKRTFKMM